jgi:short-subunit dehydrogenase
MEKEKSMVDPERYGPWAVIAGGSEGIGASIAAELAQMGTNLVLIARKPGPISTGRLRT